MRKVLDLPAPLAETFGHQCVRIRHQPTSVIILPLFQFCWGLYGHITDNKLKAPTHFYNGTHYHNIHTIQTKKHKNQHQPGATLSSHLLPRTSLLLTQHNVVFITVNLDSHEAKIHLFKVPQNLRPCFQSKTTCENYTSKSEVPMHILHQII